MARDIDEETAQTILGVAVLPFFLTTIVVSPIVRGWVLCKLWSWFIVTTFGAAPLHIVPAIGLMAVAAFIVNLPIPKTDRKEKDEWGLTMLKAVVFSLLIPLASLGFGWVVKCFM